MAKIEERYAKALLEISEENKSLQRDLEQVVLLRKTLNNEDAKSYLTHPHIPNSAKLQLFNNVFSEDKSKHIMGFLQLMVRKNHEFLILPALTKYIEQANKLLGKIEAKLVSAEALPADHIESIRKILIKQLDMEVEIKASVDPDVIGGFYVLVDGRIFDATVRYQINNVKKQLYKGKVEAKVVSAIAITEDQLESIGTMLSRKLDLVVEVKNVIDADVLGGFYILVDGRVFDSTVRTELNKMNKRLKRGKQNAN